MAPSALIVIVLLAGYVMALPALLWGLGDVANIPGGVWRHAAQRPRHQWRIGMLVAYGLGGWPVIVAALVWWRSRERADLLAEWADLSARKRRARRRSTPPRAAAEPVIVLADFEDVPSRRAGLTDA
ncbi:MAG: hypothetical protein ACXVKA_16300 [Acidimicrobiia bacterium]